MADLLSQIQSLESSLANSSVPQDLKDRTTEKLHIVAEMAKRGGEFTREYDQVSHYIDWIINLPWKARSDDILDLPHAQEILNRSHFGMLELKDRILEYLAVLQLNIRNSKSQGENFKAARAPILFFVGLVGTGKTTIAKSIAEAMGRKFARIPFGGMGDALDLRGQSRVRPDAEVGQVIKAIRRTATKNPVILLDEIDRVSEHARSDIMGVLVELLDPEQNQAFTDHYVDYPFDLSEVLFIATANNTGNISTAVLDRLEILTMPSYSDTEKISIGKNYLLPRNLNETGIPKEAITIEESVWPSIVRPLGFDAGVRTLNRTINGVCRKVARLIVEGKGQQFHLTQQNIKEFLPQW
jgi:ATP-dependent Lon protease